MRDFKALEQEHNRTPVTLSAPEQTGTGVLAIDGDKTEFRVVTPGRLNFDTDKNGWFDVQLKAGNGQRILLHNAVRLSSKRSANTEDTVTTVFPNFVAFGADHLAKDGRLTTITFTLKGLENFFHYEMIEWQSLRNASKVTRGALKDLRKLEEKYPKGYEIFSPEEIYIIHRIPRVLKFSVEDRIYEIWMGSERSLSLYNPCIRIFPCGVIHFEKPITIHAALQHVWDWRRFFSQIAMEQFPFETILARAKGRPRGYADLYLSNLGETPPSGNSPFPFNASLAPFNSWKDRHQLARSMQGWLEKQRQRDIFRANLERVIGEMYNRPTPDHILALSSGIESLPELDSASQYSAKDIKILVQGAVSAAKKENIDIDSRRLEGLIGMLRRHNLSKRLNTLGDSIAPILARDYKTIVDLAQKIRNARAHGSAGIERMAPKLPPTTEALAAMCAIWDLETSGLPFTKLTRSITSQVIFLVALDELAQMNPE